MNRDGGPAFPSRYDNRGLQLENPFVGMSLRDYFACHALPVAWQAFDAGYCGNTDASNDAIAECAYQLADAMLAEREKGGES